MCLLGCVVYVCEGMWIYVCEGMWIYCEAV